MLSQNHVDHIQQTLLRMLSFPFAATGTLFLTILTSRPSEGSLLRGSSSKWHEVAEQLPLVLCRMTIYDTMYEGGRNAEYTTCIPIVNGDESDDLVPFELPVDIVDTQREKLGQGRLFVNITNAELSDGNITMKQSSQVSVVGELPMHLRHLQERQLQSTGELTLAIIRISTSSKSPSASKADLERMTDMNEMGLTYQLNKCSLGKLNIKKASRSVVDVTVSNTANKGRMIQAAQNQVVKDLGLNHITDLADRIMFCVAPGTGNWVGAATTNYWRFELNDGYCTSLSATIHELAHTIGLPHAWKGSDKYGDNTGYMGRSYPNIAWPERCFNGVNSDLLGWYSDRTMHLSSDDPAQLVTLAGIVDYAKTTQNEPVLIKIDGKLILQYNRYKDFNTGTGANLDSIALTEVVNGNSHFRGFLRPGEVYRYGRFIISTCERVKSSSGSADTMVVSVGTGISLCGTLHRKQFLPVAPEIEADDVEPATNTDTPFPTAAPLG